MIRSVKPALYAVALAVAAAGVANAQAPQGGAQAPERGGTLIFSVTGQPDTYDCHATPSIAAMHRLSPHYSLLIRIDPDHYPAIAGDVAETWDVSADQLTYTFRLRPDIRCSDVYPITG